MQVNVSKKKKKKKTVLKKKEHTSKVIQTKENLLLLFSLLNKEIQQSQVTRICFTIPVGDSPSFISEGKQDRHLQGLR